MAGLRHVGAPSAKVLADFVGRVLGPAVDELGQVVADPVRDYRERRVKRAQELFLAAAEQVERCGQAAKAVPGRVLMPILDHGSLEDDDELREKWVNLLAAAAVRPASIPPAFATILSELSPVDARVLALCYREWAATQSPRAWSLVGNSLDLREYMEMGGISEQDGKLVEDNLIRLRLLASALPVLPSSEVTSVIDEHHSTVPWKRTSSNVRLEEIDGPVVTVLGFAFMEAVMRPKDE
jgi:hypothetical protein